MRTSFLIIMGAWSLLSASEPKISAELERRNAYLGDAVRLDITVQHDAPWVVSPKELPKELGDATVLRQEWVMAGPQADGSTTTASVLKLDLAWYRHGDFKVPPIEVTLTSGSESRTLVTPELTMEIVKLLEEKDDKPAPAKGSVDLDVPPLWPWVLAAVVVLVGLILLFVVWRRRSRKQAEVVIPPKPPYEEALDALNQLTSGSLLKEGKVKQFYVSINGIIRHYYSRMFDVNAEEMTSYELEVFLEERIGVFTGALIPLHKAFQELCDRVKFAKHDPVEAETKETTNRAYQIVELLKPRLYQTQEGTHVPAR